MEILQTITIIGGFILVVGLGGIGILKMFLEHGEKKQKTKFSSKTN